MASAEDDADVRGADAGGADVASVVRRVARVASVDAADAGDAARSAASDAGDDAADARDARDADAAGSAVARRQEDSPLAVTSFSVEQADNSHRARMSEAGPLASIQPSATAASVAAYH